MFITSRYAKDTSIANGRLRAKKYQAVKAFVTKDFEAIDNYIWSKMEVHSCVSYTEKEYYNGWKAFLCPTRLMNLKLQGPLCTFSANVQSSGRGSRNIFTWL